MLLSENASLGQQIIEVRTELDDVRNRDISSGVSLVQRQLSAKIAEFGGIIAELGNLRKKPRMRKSQVMVNQHFADQQQIRDRPRIDELLAAQPDRLPSIREDKQYPRITMEYDDMDSVYTSLTDVGRSHDIQQILDDNARDSPDIGSPPQTFFDRELSSRQFAKESTDITDVQTDLLSTNLETRRRKRDRRSSNFGATSTTTTMSQDYGDPSQSVPQSLKAGAKRKFESRDHTIITSPEKILNELPKKTEGGHKTVASKNASPMADENRPTSLARKALSIKSTNISPRKEIFSGALDPRKAAQCMDSLPTTSIKKIPIEPMIPSDTSLEPRRATEVATIAISQDYDLISTVELPMDDISLDPRTPNLLDLFSPTVSQPSDQRPEGRDGTPPPKNYQSTASTAQQVEMAAGRGSRRARANVSYAEPSLNSKMRRPDKRLADAVTISDCKATSLPADKVNSEASTDLSLRPSTRGLTVEEDINQEWKPRAISSKTNISHDQQEPQSPSQGRTSALTVSPLLDENHAVEKRKSRAPSAKVEAPIASLANSKTASSIGPKELFKDTSVVDVFDVIESPPRHITLTDRTRSNSTITGRISGPKIARRRQTLNNSSSPKNEVGDSFEAKDNSNEQKPTGRAGSRIISSNAVAIAERRERIAARRKSMMV